jgi:HAMP domain-containing protein
MSSSDERSIVRSLLRWIGVIMSVAIVAVCAFAIWRMVQRSRQVQSNVLLEMMGHSVERVPLSERTPETLQRAISGVYGGRDAWGNSVAVYMRTQPVSYVLVSRGSDGRPDTTSTAAYFTMAESNIQRQTERDIVFRDGKVITFGGK